MHMKKTNSWLPDNLTIQELKSTLKKFQQNLLPGTDGITNEMLEHLARKLKEPCCSSSTSSKPIPEEKKGKYKKIMSYGQVNLLS